MSHFSTVESQMKDLECILEAIKDLGMECVHSEEGVNVRGYNQQLEKADISIKVSGKYDVGIRLTENGCELLADWWGVEATRGVNEQQFTNQLQQRYAYHKVVKELKAKHYTLDMNEDKTTNVIKLTATKWG
ncbi:MAG: DUF1257 domain-containing protein [Proteobacteria bacterium]|nr:DUF1257 domain-containing protein [Pseudomonadota bacterium]MBQ4359694.1 DUF1257 domain-containing protein [Pseudomonadota bacterium]